MPARKCLSMVNTNVLTAEGRSTSLAGQIKPTAGKTNRQRAKQTRSKRGPLGATVYYLSRNSRSYGKAMEPIFQMKHTWRKYSKESNRVLRLVMVKEVCDACKKIRITTTAIIPQVFRKAQVVEQTSYFGPKGGNLGQREPKCSGSIKSNPNPLKAAMLPIWV